MGIACAVLRIADPFGDHNTQYGTVLLVRYLWNKDRVRLAIEAVLGQRIAHEHEGAQNIDVSHVFAQHIFISGAQQHAQCLGRRFAEQLRQESILQNFVPRNSALPCRPPGGKRPRRRRKQVELVNCAPAIRRHNKLRCLAGHGEQQKELVAVGLPTKR